MRSETMRPAALWLADEFFLIAHRDYDGKPRLNSSALTLGLAGTLLTELALHRRIRINPQTLELIVANPDPPPDATAHAILDQLIAEPEIMSIATWLQFLGQSSAQRVGDRLVRAGFVRPQLVGPPWRRTILYPPLDANEAILPAVRIQGVATQRQPVELADALLIGFAAATGLDGYLFQDLDAESRQFLRDVISQLPRTLMCLVAETKAAVGAAVLARRR
ncbi:MAG TPA: GPP34 family phosphoprotein [Pseudonocardiaceae bacterium]|nr:GPP34 family phosphoprotein [Pseudonocardiaceae bacterium]